MIAKPPHNRKLGICGVSLTKARLPKHDAEAATWVQDVVEKVLIESDYLEGAPFSWVTIAVRYGLKNDDKPIYQRINKTYGDLPLAIEVDTHEMMGASLDDLKRIFLHAVLKALIHAGQKYGRPVAALESMQVSIPDSFDM
ncbi:MAG: Imm39 family immunity protein [Pseudomonadota bacterium]